MKAPGWFLKALHEVDPALEVYWNPYRGQWDLFRLYGRGRRLPEPMAKGEIISVGELDGQPAYRYRPTGAFLTSLKPPLGLDQVNYIKKCDMWNPDIAIAKRKAFDDGYFGKQRDEANMWDAMKRDITTGYKWANTIKVGV